jgi:hypothetical protein|tara:strand:+ start:37 stop:435 length:399 start_codon:yes stop_codon:yes gene_type:complete
MKNINKYIQLTMVFLFLSCEETGGITGSENVSEISNVSFSNIVTSITESNLVANGIIKNDSQTLTISPPWYIECQFYYNDNSGNTFLIGGENIKINNSLSPNVSLEWTLEHQTNNPENYNNFTINDLRAYKH